ncbi:MAG: hypothetical protein HY331_07735 [Chloroflexi bacterium]|nr:hypothetical protein [Chloroflexota bacterium]
MVEAIGRGTAEVTELAPPQVNTLRVSNTGKLPVFIMDGEELLGGGQNRVANGSVLVPTGAAIELAVSCVERGRWSGFTARFRSEGNAPFRLRRVRAESVQSAQQAAVWAEVDEVHAALQVDSPTAALHDAYVARAGRLEDYASAFPLPAEAIGVVLTIGGVCLMADLFDHPAILAAYWDRLVRSYALEALGQPLATLGTEAAADFVSKAVEARMNEYPAVGLGQSIRLEGESVVGTAVAYDGTSAHVGLYRRGEVRQSHNMVVGLEIPFLRRRPADHSLSRRRRAP